MAIGGADQEARLAHAIIAPAPQQRGKFFGRELLAAFIQQDFAGRGQRSGDRAARIGQLGLDHRPGDPLHIAGDQLSLG